MITAYLLQAPGTDHPALFTLSPTLTDPHWIHQRPQPDAMGRVDCDFRFQHLHPVMRCELRPQEDVDGTVKVTLEHPLRAITMGQYGVLYLGEECLGAGRIRSPGQSLYALKQTEAVKLKAEFR